MTSPSENLYNTGRRLRGKRRSGLVNKVLGQLYGGGMQIAGALGSVSPVSGGAAAKAVGAGAGAAVKGVAKGVTTVAAPGGQGVQGLNRLVDTAGTVPGASALGVSTLPLLIAGTAGALYASQAGRPDSLVVGDIDPYTGFSNYQRLNDAYDNGVNPMTDAFNGYAMQKRAANPLATLSTKGMSAIDEIAKKLIMKTTDESVTDKVVQRLIATSDPAIFANGNLPIHEHRKMLIDTAESMYRDGLQTTVSHRAGELPTFQHVSTEVSVPKAVMLGAAGLGAGVAGMGMDDNPLEPLGYKARKAMFSVEDRIGADELYAKSYVQQLAKNNAELLGEMVRDSTLEAQEAVRAIPRSRAQLARTHEIIQGDDMLSGATEGERDMLIRAYTSMQKFAPTLAGDEFATRNFLRESYTAANGPDFGTIGNLARAERDVTGGKK